MTPRVSAIVVTLGRSPWLQECLEALRREGGREIEILLVEQGGFESDLASGLVDRVLSLTENRGFAGGTNLGIAESRGELVAPINDDAIVEAGWLAPLIAELEREPALAAVQGTNRRHRDRSVVDGCGLSFNRSWQALQIHQGDPVPTSSSTNEVFGVSATAAIYRRSALDAVAFAPGVSFDERLRSYYEDVDLACRLRAHGFGAFHVPLSTASHVGSLTGQSINRERLKLLYSNRYLVLARMLGGEFWSRMPGILRPDLGAFVKAPQPQRSELRRGIVSGWIRAARNLPAFSRSGDPEPSLEQLEPLLLDD